MSEINEDYFDKLMSPEPKKIVNINKSRKQNVLVVGDLHQPFTQQGYLDFCIEQYKRWKCTKVVIIGDEVDNHAASYHEADPDGLSAGTEGNMAEKKLKEWYKAFPRVFVTIGNHSALPQRKGRSGGLSMRFIKGYKEAWNAPVGWNWLPEVSIDDVLYFHGTGKCGAQMAYNWALEKMQSVVVGHAHSIASVRYIASHKNLIFAMNVGTGINHNAYAFNYNLTKKPVVSCGIVLEGEEAHIIPMRLV